jgi:hypothetical protein
MRERTKLPSRDELLLLFVYCPETGILSRKSDGHIPTCRGKYVRVAVDGKCSLAHRVIWKMMTDEETHLIDHIDCDGRNNKWLNLRSAEHRENLRNRGAPKNNTSGVKGVSFDSATSMWRASITVDYKAINLGRYPSIHQASEARRIASEKMHGQFARVA